MVAVNGELIVQKAVSSARSHFHHTGAFIRERRHRSLGEVLLGVEVTGGTDLGGNLAARLVEIVN